MQNFVTVYYIDYIMIVTTKKGGCGGFRLTDSIGRPFINECKITARAKKKKRVCMIT